MYDWGFFGSFIAWKLSDSVISVLCCDCKMENRASGQSLTILEDQDSPQIVLLSFISGYPLKTSNWGHVFLHGIWYNFMDFS